MNVHFKQFSVFAVVTVFAIGLMYATTQRNNLIADAVTDNNNTTQAADEDTQVQENTLGAKDQSYLYNLQQLLLAVENDQSLTSIQRSKKMQDINAKQLEFAGKYRVKDWECKVIDVVSSSNQLIGPSNQPSGTKFAVSCKYKELTLGLYFDDDNEQLGNLSKGSTVRFDAQTRREICGWAHGCIDQSFPTRFKVQNIRLVK
jgi:hypothetical protein